MNTLELKDGRSALLRRPRLGDAPELMEFVRRIDSETPYMLREPGEFDLTLRREREIIRSALGSGNLLWLVAELEGRIVASAGWSRVSSREKYRHRAEAGVAVLRCCWGLGLGRGLMNALARSAADSGVLQLELTCALQNRSALALYESLGYRRVGYIPRAVRYRDGSFGAEVRLLLELDR